MKLLRTIRFDSSDDRVYECAAGPDEWAVSGGFAFAGLTAPPTGKQRQAFTNGFLSLEGFGRSTFVSVAQIEEPEVARLTEALAGHFVSDYGAPGMAAAGPVAQDEIGFVLDLCRDAPVNTVLAVRRSFDEEGQIREEFRSVAAPGEAVHTRIWDVVEE
jgi:hypothetical protein